nr:unnamed protein product [Callosobruchus analis]
MSHFVKYSNASLQNHFLLILDNHKRHVRFEVIQFAKENGVTLLTIPPHTTGRLPNLSEEPTPSTSMIILTEVIRPYPKSGPRKTMRRGRRPRKTKILTETPEKTDNGNENKKIKLIATQTKGREKQHKTRKSVVGPDEMLDMRLCVSCQKYVHKICVGLTESDTELFKCPSCSA